MKNVLFIVVDSVFEEVIHDNPNVFPFIESIKDNCLYFSNVFSQGPYTEAGTKGLLCSEKTLDNETYLCRYSKAKHFISELFKSNGYRTTSIIYPTTLYNDRIVRSFDQIAFSSVFIPTVFLEQKINFYRDIKNKKGLDDSEYNRIIDIFDDVFYFWSYSLDRKAHPDNFLLLNKYDDSFPYDDLFELINKEMELYKKDKRSYLDGFFEGNNDILSIDTFKKTNFVKNGAFIEALATRKRFANTLAATQLKVALRSFSEFISNCKGKSLSKKRKYFLMWLKGIKRSFDIYVPKKSDNYKLLLSAKSQFDYAFELLSNKKEQAQFVMLHVEEPHYFNTFYSYDSKDLNVIQNELDYAKEYMKLINKSYRGSLYYDLSLRYIDLQIKNLFNRLDNVGLLENTTIVITADHGSSYSGRFLRHNATINFYKENYHIPFIIFDKSICGREVNNLAMNIDIIPTLMNFLSLKIPSDLDGINILSDDERKYVFVEYMGSGCPDIHLKNAWISIINNNYQVCYIGPIFEDFSERKIVEIYNLKSDPSQKNNNLAEERTQELTFLISKLKERFYQLKHEYGY